MLTLESATYRLGRATLVEDATLAVIPGAVTVVLGPNGAGKSTVLRLLSGEIHPSAGDARIDDVSIRSLSAPDLARRRAVVPQRSDLAFDFRVVDVVLLGRHPYNGGYATPSDLRLARSLLSDVGLDGFEDRGYLSLSGGERQRVHIARSRAQLVTDEGSAQTPRYWLLDEPTSALDLAHQHRLMKSARQRADEGVGVLVVLHDLNLALRYADDVVLMSRGRVFARGDVQEVLTSSNLQAVYGVAADVVAIPPHWTPQVVVR